MTDRRDGHTDPRKRCSGGITLKRSRGRSTEFGTGTNETYRDVGRVPSRVSSPAHCDNKGEKMTASYEFEKAMQETIANQDALIKQLGEALQDLWIRRGTVNGKEHDAVTAYNNWKRERGG